MSDPCGTLQLALKPNSVPCWWVSWWLWRAGCISQDTYLLYIFYQIIYLCQVKHIYELTPTQARELKRLVEEAEDSDNDFIVT